MSVIGYNYLRYTEVVWFSDCKKSKDSLSKKSMDKL